MRPPATHNPKGMREAPSAPRPSAIGKIPNTVLTVVIKMGRKRAQQASMMACSGVAPLRCFSTAKSTKIIPFFLIIPINMNSPMKAYKENSAPNNVRVNNPPARAIGKVDNTVKG